MAISVEVPQIFRKHTQGAKLVTVEGATIREVIQRLDQDYPGLKKQLLTDDGEGRSRLGCREAWSGR